MREKFPRKHAGDIFTDADYRKLTRITRRLGAGGFSGDTAGLSTQNGEFVTQHPAQPIDILIVDGQFSEFIYRVRRRWYDHENQQWRNDAEMNLNDMDAEDVDLSFETGDKVVGYWDFQRKAWIPVLGGKTVDPMWCAKICECVLERSLGSCCVYRGRVKRISPSDTWSSASLCDPPKIVKNAWIISECDTNLAAGGGAEGWVRKVDEDIEITWSPSVLGEPITETLDLYEWCCWPPDECPDPETGSMFAEISYHDDSEVCEEANGIGTLTMDYREWDGRSLPWNNNDCGNYDGWFVEFSVPAVIPVRLTAMQYKVAGDDAWRFGYLRPNWLTGEPVAWYDDDLNGIDEPDLIDTAVVNGRTVVSADGSTAGECRILEDAEGNMVEETVTRHYRLSVRCLESTGDLAQPCIQLLYPPGHPIYLEGDYLGNPGLNDPVVLQDPNASDDALEFAIATGGSEQISLTARFCDGIHPGTFDGDFGQGHQTVSQLNSVVPDGAFNGTWPDIHMFCGCFDDVDLDNCQLTNIGVGGGGLPSVYKFNIIFTWTGSPA